MARQNKTSAVELQVMWNRLIAIVDEQAQALMHIAFSPTQFSLLN